MTTIPTAIVIASATTRARFKSDARGRGILTVDLHGSVMASFSAAFWPALFATILGGGIVAGAGYWFLDRALHFRDRADRAEQIETARADRAKEIEDAQRAVRDSILTVARGELQYVAARLKTYRDALGNNSVPFPTFDTNGWALMSQAQAFTTLKPDTSGKLIMAYNRVRSFNDRLTAYADLTQGGTATLFHITAAGTADTEGKLPAVVTTIVGQYESLKKMSSDALRQRLTELEPHVHDAIDAVKAELGVVGERSSAEITYDVGGEPPLIVPLAAVPHSKD